MLGLSVCWDLSQDNQGSEEAQATAPTSLKPTVPCYYRLCHLYCAAAVGRIAIDRLHPHTQKSILLFCWVSPGREVAPGADGKGVAAF